MTDTLPPSCEVLVVGAGITGLSLAYHLAADGAGPILVVDRSGVGAEASGVAPGGVRQQWSTPVNCLLARESVAFFQDFNDRVQSDVKPTLEACGYLFLAHSDATLEQLRASVEVQNNAGVVSQILSPEEAAARAPGLAIDSVVGAAWCSEDGYFDQPRSVVEAFAQAVEGHGVKIAHATITQLEHSATGWKVGTSDGGVVHAKQVVLATGYGTPELASGIGVELPIEKQARHLFFSNQFRQRLLEPLVVSGEQGVAAKQIASGRVMVGDLRTDLNGETPAARLDRLHTQLGQLLPHMSDLKLPVVVEGFYDNTPDHQPIIDQVADGLWVAAGFSGHGFMISPAIGQRLSRILAGGPADELLSEFSLARFANDELETESTIV